MKNLKRTIIFVLNFLIIIQANAKGANVLTMMANNEIAKTSTNKDDESEPKGKKLNKISRSKNFHSIKKWKITIEYIDGGFMSKTISVKDNSELSPMETAFAEAEKYLETIDNVKEYSVAPVSNNSFVLLVGQE
ncbi:hypothetical protein [Aquimarina sediminis]|uniref:hypothetical protein n=1 Tax=Aquimarina sediminis TaxID=2070536 RepID=UPI000CA04E17|nr:hypothetical protein [Aquimarina sediminis]